MWIARIEPDEPGHDRRTFECPECDHTIIEVVKYKYQGLRTQAGGNSRNRGNVLIQL
jgi:hypothetical protein